MLIDTDVVVAVLLADGWHEVANDTFAACPMDFDFGGERAPGWAAGFLFTDTDGRRLHGPPSSIIAVNTGRIPRGDVEDGDES
jgi:hypothetical protein